MQRPEKNFFIDTLGFVGFVLLTSTGILMRYILPPGSGRSRVIWGMDRHQWGDIHFWTAVVFLGVLTIHLILHWKWIVTFIKGSPREGSGFRAGLGVVGLVGLTALAIAPLVSRVETTTGTEKNIRLSERHDEIGIMGSMTLQEASLNSGVPVEHFIRELKLPPDTGQNERLGTLKKIYGFTIEDVRKIVQDYKSGHHLPEEKP